MGELRKKDFVVSEHILGTAGIGGGLEVTGVDKNEWRPIRSLPDASVLK